MEQGIIGRNFGESGSDDAELCPGVDKFGTKEPISIVAFSMGGLVSRYYLQNLGGAKRCEQLITISSPHNGTTAAWWYPSQGAREMRPKSAFLTELKRTEPKLGDMKITSYRTPMDLVILPADSSKWDRADHLTFPVLLHPLMLVSKPVMDDIEKRLVVLWMPGPRT